MTWTLCARYICCNCQHFYFSQPVTFYVERTIGKQCDCMCLCPIPHVDQTFENKHTHGRTNTHTHARSLLSLSSPHIQPHTQIDACAHSELGKLCYMMCDAFCRIRRMRSRMERIRRVELHTRLTCFHCFGTFFSDPHFNPCFFANVTRTSGFHSNIYLCWSFHLSVMRYVSY